MGHCQNTPACQKEALENAKHICAQQDVRLTPIRQRVLELVWEHHKPVKAYDILSQLQSEMPSAQPPTVYRALDFLMENGFIHKLQSMNAYIGCHHPSPDTENCYFLICSHCDETLEMQLPHTEQRLIKNIEKHQFQVQHITVEIAGLCKTCQTAA